MSQQRVMRAFTLIEMMIALVITMMMVFAMVEAFRWIGDATTDGRAQIEMSGQIRAARYRLELDLNGVTVPLRPWVDSQAYAGYFELIEGAGCDSHPWQFISRRSNTYLEFDFNDPAYPPAGYTAPAESSHNDNDTSAIAWKTIFGDVDDILCFTARNDDTPFRGRYQDPATGKPIIIESNLAEIIWWSELNDLNNNDRWDPRETFTIRRRVLLIRPDLSLDGDSLVVLPGTAHADSVIYDPDPANPSTDKSFLKQNDLSVRYKDPADPAQGLYANSLAHLAIRKNRAAHVYDTNNQGLTDKIAGGSGTKQYTSPLQLSLIPAFPPFYPTATQRVGGDLVPDVTQQLMSGEDIILSGVTAFDLRVWDPDVPVVTDTAELNEALVPGDPGYNNGIAPGGTYDSTKVVGQGAYVDLGGMALDAPATPTPATATNSNTLSQLMSNSFPMLFSGRMEQNARLQVTSDHYTPFVYDPWPLEYERDNFDQDRDNTVDEGSNGIDDDGQYGADDGNERETQPPYPHRLKAIRVTIRVYEPDTRQVKQQSHEMSFGG